MKSFYIMHLQRRVATMRTDGSCTIYYPGFMPYNLYLEKADDLDTRMNNLSNFWYWCSSRVLTLDRKYAKEILNSLGLQQAVTDRDRARISISYHALSLTDVFWVQEMRERLQYSDINLYRNSLSNAFVDVALRGRQLTAQNAQMIKDEDAAGDLATAGVAPKAWVRADGTFWLYKDGDPADIAAELLASKIARCFRVPQVIYEEKEYDGQPASACRLITSLEKSIVPAEYIEIYMLNHNSTLARFVQKRDAYGFCMMNIIDYLVGNTDRHRGNWGFTADNASNRLEKLHPLMDFNKAFHVYNTLDGARCQTISGNISQREAAVDAVQKVGLNQIAEISAEWFDTAEKYEMFSARLQILKDAAGIR